MKLRQITWQNFRRLPDAQIDVRKHLVLVGPNDTGKSSVLRIVDLCLGVSGARLAALITDRDFTDPSVPLVLQVVLDGIEDADRAAFPDEISTTAGETLTVEVEAVIEVEDSEQIQIRRWFPDAGHGRSPTKVQLSQFGWAYVSPTRSLFRELGSWINRCNADTSVFCRPHRTIRLPLNRRLSCFRTLCSGPQP